MRFETPLISATLLRRYKRFLADVRLADGSEITAHCPNTGTMRGCSEPKSEVMLSISDNPKRKYPHTLEMIMAAGNWVGVNTNRTNAIVAEALQHSQVLELAGCSELQREVTVCKGSRLDIRVRHNNRLHYIEVKNCSLAEAGRALFPDAVTTRGTKHLHELINLAREGYGATIFFLVQRSDAESFAPAAAIDPIYAKTLAQAMDAGVQALAYQASVTPKEIKISRSLPVIINT